MNLNTYLQQLDLAKLDLQPLNDHFIAERLNEQEKELYLTMISSFILLDELTEPRTRLFQLYLHACKTEHQQGKIFNLAQNISKDQIKEFIRICNDNSLVESFFVDAFVFTRLDKSLDDKSNTLFNEWINLFDLKNETIETIVYFVSNILGLKCKYKLNSLIDINKLNVWIPYCLEKFEIGSYESNRAYHLYKDCIIHSDIAICENIFVFDKDKKITFSDCEKVEIKSSEFLNALFEIEQESKLLIEDCIFKGSYDETKKENLFSVGAQDSWMYGNNIEDITFRNNIFDVTGVRAIYLKQEANIENCIFNNCGNSNLIGGAIYTESNIKLINSKFNSCFAKVAGAIYCKSLDDNNHISNCIFNTCLSLDYQNVSFSTDWNNDWNKVKESYRGKLNAGGIWINGTAIRGIHNTQFIACNVYIKRASHSSHSDLIYNTKFIDSILSIGDSDQDILNNCSFDKGPYRLDSNIYQSAGELTV